MSSQPLVDTAPLPAQRIGFETWCAYVLETLKARHPEMAVRVDQTFNKMYAEGFSWSLAASELWRMSIGL